MEQNIQTNKPTKFHVFIIESPSDPDLFLNQFEGEALSKTLSLAGISSSYRITVSRNAFRAAFTVGLKDYFESHSNLPIIIHISAHGSKSGIELTNGDIIEWKELKEYLLPVNQKVNGTLLVCMSSCEGFSGYKMAINDDQFPFLGIIGNSEKPTWSDTNIAFATLYHLLSKGKTFTDAVNAMNVASGNNNFILSFAKSARTAYLNLIKNISIKTYQAPEITNPLDKKIESKLEEIKQKVNDSSI